MHPCSRDVSLAPFLRSALWTISIFVPHQEKQLRINLITTNCKYTLARETPGRFTSVILIESYSINVNSVLIEAETICSAVLYFPAYYFSIPRENSFTAFSVHYFKALKNRVICAKKKTLFIDSNRVFIFQAVSDIEAPEAMCFIITCYTQQCQCIRHLFAQIVLDTAGDCVRREKVNKILWISSSQMKISLRPAALVCSLVCRFSMHSDASVCNFHFHVIAAV